MKKNKKKQRQLSVQKNRRYLVLVGMLLLVGIFIYMSDQGSNIGDRKEVEFASLPSPPPIPGQSGQYPESDMGGQAAGPTPSNPVCAFAVYNDADCPQSQLYGQFNVPPSITYSASGTNRLNVDIPRSAQDTYRYIMYRYGYIYKKVNGISQWVPFEFTFQNEQTIPFDNKEANVQGKDIWLDITGTGTAATADSASDLIIDLTNFYTTQSNFIVAWVCRCQGADCNNRAKGWNSQNWECNPSTADSKGVNNGRWALRTFNIAHSLTLSTAGTGVGTVRSDPVGIDCGTDCTEAYTGGIDVTLTAAPSAGSTFAGWSGGSGVCDGTSIICTVTMDAAKAVTATFSLNQYTLAVAKAGTGTGTVAASPGIDCGADCTEAYNHGTSVTLTATPNAESAFTGWGGGVCVGTGTCTVTMDAAKAVTATFSLNQYTLAVAKAGTGTGTVTSTPAGINCAVLDTICNAVYDSGTSVTLTAAASAGSQFLSWSGACTGTTCTVAMDQTKSATATFQKDGITDIFLVGGFNCPPGSQATEEYSYFVLGTTTQSFCISKSVSMDYVSFVNIQLGECNPSIGGDQNRLANAGYLSSGTKSLCRYYGSTQRYTNAAVSATCPSGYSNVGSFDSNAGANALTLCVK